MERYARVYSLIQRALKRRVHVVWEAVEVNHGTVIRDKHHETEANQIAAPIMRTGTINIQERNRVWEAEQTL